MKRHHWIILVVILAALVLGIVAACDQGGAPMEVPRPAGPALAVDDANRTVTITDPSHPDRPLVIRVDPSTGAGHMDCGDFHIVSARGYVQEFTSRDFLELSVEDLGNGRRLEHYYFNGNALDLEIDDANGPTPEQRQAFLDFYPTDPAENSLEGHPDGRIMSDLLARAQPAVMRLVQERNPEGYQQLRGASTDDGSGPLQIRPQWLDIGCGLAATCAMIACKILPLTNPVCWVCLAAATACAIMSLFGW